MDGLNGRWTDGSIYFLDYSWKISSFTDAMWYLYVAGFIETIIPSVQAIPAELRPEFMDDALKIYLEVCPRSEEGLPAIAVDCLAVHAQRKD